VKKLHKRTTIAGILAAIGTALMGAAILPPPWNLIPVIISVIGQALLGAQAADAKTVNDKLKNNGP